MIAINKADGDNLKRANLAAADYRSALHILAPRSEHWHPPVETYSALTGAGLLATVAPEIGLPRKDEPAEGDIGVIEVAGKQVAAIRSGAHWIFRTPRGVSFARRSALAIWGD